MILTENEQRELLLAIRREQFYNIFRWTKCDLRFKNYLIRKEEFYKELIKLHSLDHNFHYGQIKT